MRKLLIAAFIAALVLSLSACGSDSSSSSSETTETGGETTATETGDETETAAAKTIVEEPPTTPPTKIQVTEPLTKVPPAGKNVVFFICELPDCVRFKSAAEQAATALNWNVEFMTLSSTAPDQSLQQGVARKPDYIFIAGVPTAALAQGMKEAREANIPVFGNAVPEKPSPEGFVQMVNGSFVLSAEEVSSWITNDSGGHAHIVGVSISSYPALVEETEWMKANVPNMCEDCTYGELDVSVEDLGGGKVPSLLTAYLQANPETNYVYFTFSDLGATAPPALKAAGFSDVKLTGCCGNAPNAEQIAAGEQSAWTFSPNAYYSYAAFDGMARLSVGMKLTTEYQESLYEAPFWVADSPESVKKYIEPTNFEWRGPENFEQQFEELWGVH